ncbi:carboxypeptidase-like regulatory domain-containing protein [Pseudaquidulcibacter saccharophilus]|uniref:carboxypeptidase-like regulatory domain-containing protein n=1 Tax=Pseudaquidulcibacter saccharophilus TaxID=2831900 RepID=UPI001EFF08DB|nr:carboxypeptidase-like regulatory domain-containing protein [Pseudaquidulcibacter saccharophilus]
MAVSAYAGPKTVYDVANQHAQQDASNFITIKQTFDEAATKKALEYGNTSINGVLYSQASADGYDALVFTKKNPIKFAKKRKVYLYPITPYLVEYVNLYKKNRGDNNQQLREIRADQRLFDNSIYVVTDEYGRFSFPNMKPGRYFLHAESDLQGEDNVDVETGYTKYIGGGMGVSYETQTRSWSKPVICEMEIEVKPGEKVKQIDARLNTHPLKWAKPISLGK